MQNLSRIGLSAGVAAVIFAGCSAGSQFTPSSGSAESQPAVAFQPAAPVHAVKSGRDAHIMPDLFMYDGMITIGNKVFWWYWNIWGQLKWGWISGIAQASNLGGSSSNTKQLDAATTDDTIDILSGQKLVTTLTGLNGAASGVGTDSRGNTFAAVNLGSQTVVEEFAKGATTPTATYPDSNLSSAVSLGIDKANRVYVEGQSQGGAIEVDELVGSGTFMSLAQPGGLGVTAGGLAVQTSGKTTYVYINDLGNASDPANITRYEMTGKSLISQGSFQYAGINGAIAVDPSGKDTTHVYAANNVPAGSAYSVSEIEYEFPSGAVVRQTPAQSAGEESTGIWVK